MGYGTSPSFPGVSDMGQNAPVPICKSYTMGAHAQRGAGRTKGGQGRAGQGRAGQGRAGQGRGKQGSTGKEGRPLGRSGPNCHNRFSFARMFNDIKRIRISSPLPLRQQSFGRRLWVSEGSAKAKPPDLVP
jgi:hypothetical protein